MGEITSPPLFFLSRELSSSTHFPPNNVRAVGPIVGTDSTGRKINVRPDVQTCFAAHAARVLLQIARLASAGARTVVGGICIDRVTTVYSLRSAAWLACN
jgi:hypothetical protein